MSTRARIGTICALILAYTLTIPVITFLVTFWLIVSWLKAIWRSMNWEPEWPLDYFLIKQPFIKSRQSLTEITSMVEEGKDARL